MLSHKLLAGAALIASALPAQTLTGVSSGFVFDEQAHSLRAVIGVPGAAYLGSALESGLDAASISPDGSLAVTLRGGQLKLIELATGKAAILGEFEGAANQFAWNGDSLAVAGASLARFRKLKSTPERENLAMPASPISALAIDSAGRVLAAAQDGVYLTGAEAARLIHGAPGISAIAVSGSDLFIASAASKQVFVTRGYAASPETMLVASEASGLDTPSALAGSPDGSLVYVADRAAKALFAFRPATAELAFRLDLDFEPTRLDRFHGNLFLLNSRTSASQPVQLFDAAQSAVYFVPAEDLSQAASVEE